MKTFSIRIILPTILTILLFVLTIFFIVIPRYKENIMNGKREMIRELTNSAWSILQKYHNDELAGTVSREQAQTAAISRIQYLRYGDENKDYFWITDLTPKMIMHPFREDLNGKDLTNFQDPHGKRMFVAFVETVKESEQGYVDYMWQWKDDSLHIVPKLSYVKIFKPWNWVIGTGIYIEDAKREIASLTRNLIWMSTGISLLIAILLSYLLQQSLKIEKKRVEAENELHESRERYRTLVEAATEGILMVVDGKITYSNSIIREMTGFDESDLKGRPFNDLICPSNNKVVVETFSKNIIKEGLFEVNLIKNPEGVIEVLITSSTSSLLGKTVNILVIKNLTSGRKEEFSNLEYQKLINTLNLGFFKAKLDFKGRFLYANETALRILGYESFNELASTTVLELLALAEDRKALRTKLISSGFLKNHVIKLQQKNGEISIVSVTLVLINKENPADMVCDGIIEDITTSEMEKELTNRLICEFHSAGFKMEQPVKEFVSPMITADADVSLKDVISLMNKKKSGVVLLTKNQSDYLGIITKSDIQHRILALGLDLENPAYLIMSSPIITIPGNQTVSDAMHLCDEKNIHHLAIRNDLKGISGIFSVETVYQALLHTHSYLTSSLHRFESMKDFQASYLKMQKLVMSLIKSGTSIRQITGIASSFSDVIIRRLVELAQLELGPPPVDFAFICLGSEGRKEETLFTDQDNAIIYKDVEENRQGIVRDYFLRLGETVNDALDQIGYSYCRGNVMAKNPQWCQPYSVWEKYFISWMTAPEPQNLLDAIIFFDFRCIYGNNILTDQLRNSIRETVRNKPIFLYHLAYHTCMPKPLHITGGILSDKSGENLDLKHAILPIVMFARTYAIKNDIWFTNTNERLEAIKDRKIISESSAEDLIFIYNFLMQLRFRNQMQLSENQLPLSNVLNVRTLHDIETSLLKKSLSLISDYQAKVKSDFSVSG